MILRQISAAHSKEFRVGNGDDKCCLKAAASHARYATISEGKGLRGSGQGTATIVLRLQKFPVLKKMRYVFIKKVVLLANNYCSRNLY